MILDTNALSAFIEGDRGIEAALRHAGDAAIPVIALGEFRYGIATSRQRKAYEQWLDANLRYFRILPVDQETTLHYAGVRAALRASGRPIPANDVWIAALALQHDRPVLSLDSHFDAVPGLTRIGW